MSRCKPIKLVLPALAALFVIALPTGVGASAREPADTCQNPALYGQSDDQDTFFRFPPYPFGRGAEHIYFGVTTVQVEVHDESTAHNFRLRDLTWDGAHYDRSTGVASTGTECWVVPLELVAGVEVADYEWLSDEDPTQRRGIATNHPPLAPPPPPPPGGPPPPPPPPPGPPGAAASA